MITHSSENDFMVFNPDTIWSNEYRDEIIKMEEGLKIYVNLWNSVR